jgi:hypothetical protein
MRSMNSCSQLHDQHCQHVGSKCSTNWQSDATNSHRLSFRVGASPGSPCAEFAAVELNPLNTDAKTAATSSPAAADLSANTFCGKATITNASAHRLVLGFRKAD